MSDTMYFTCLATTILCAVWAPLAAAAVLRGKDRSHFSVLLCIACVAGVACSVPFMRTREMAWFPPVAGTYFMAVLITAVLHGISVVLEKMGSVKAKSETK